MTTIQTFTASEIRRLRRCLQDVMRPPAEKASEGWSISRVDPMAAVELLESVGVGEGFVLRAYQYREGRNGRGFVYALPEEAVFPPPASCPSRALALRGGVRLGLAEPSRRLAPDRDGGAGRAGGGIHCLQSPRPPEPLPGG